MAHCPTCQQHPGTLPIALAGLFGSRENRFDCGHCFRAVAVPTWQRKVVWAWTLGVPLVAVGGIFAVAPMWWWLGFVATPVTPFLWARWWATVVRPEDATMAKPPRRHSRKNRRKQKLM